MQEISVPFRASLPADKKPGAEYYLNVSVCLKQDTLWAKAGHEVAYEQFHLPNEIKAVVEAPSSAGVTVTGQEDGTQKLTVSGNAFSFALDKTTSRMENYVYDSETLIELGPVPNYWRALVENDKNRDNRLQTLCESVRAQSVTVDENGPGGLTTITIPLTFGTDAFQGAMKQTMTYTVEKNGAVTVSTEIDGRALPGGGNRRFLRVGTDMLLPAGFNEVKWYGNGPVESLLDRKTFARVGVYDSTADALYYPYMSGGDSSFTIEAYIRPIDLKAGSYDAYNMIAGKGDHCAAFRFSEGKLFAFICNQNGTWNNVTQEIPAADAQKLHHVAMIYSSADGGTLSTYLNGTLQTSTGVGSVKDSSYPLWIGYCQETSRTSDGEFNSFRVYSEALSKEELDKGDAEKLRKDSLVLWYDFSERARTLALRNAVDDCDASGRQEENYSAASWGAYQAALKAAKEKLNAQPPLSATEQLQIDAALAALNAAIDALGTDKTALRALYDEKATLSEDDYTPASWAPSGGGSSASVGRPSVREDAGQSQAAAEQTHFIDVLRDSWYYSSVYRAHENSLIDGVGGRRFSPDATLTVAQAIKLSAALHQLDRTGEVSLKNGAGNWYDSYVSYAIANGILEERYAGYSREQMNAPVTRAEFVHIFHGALEHYEQLNTVADNAIPDVKLGDAFAAEIYELYRAGILHGNDTAGTFRPESTIKRSEAAAILNRMYDKTARKTVSLP